VDPGIDMIEKYLLLKKKNISRLQFILEGYDGMAMATTIDKNRAIVKLFIMPDFTSDIEPLLKSLSVDLSIKEIHFSEI